jgi:glycosyltransferase involved in cell wall biosynthesis
MRLVVGIATVGRREILTETLAEIASQSRLPDGLVVCVTQKGDLDEGAVEGLPFPSCVIHSDPGLPIQRNAIMRHAGDADVIVFFDDDFFPETAYLANVEALFRTHPDIVVATGKLLADGIHGPGLSPDHARRIIAAHRDKAPEEGTVAPRYGAYGCNMAVRLAPVRANGIEFDERLPLYAWQEDIDFSRQLAAYGEIVEADALTGVHLGTKRGRTSGVRIGYSQIANPIYLIRKGTMSLSFGSTRMSKNVLANIGRALGNDPYVDRLGRLKGNLLALGDFVRGRIDPGRILEL